MAMCLGGRTAEEIVFNEPTTGAENDIEKVTRIARAMVTEYGMSEALGPMRFGHPHGEVFLGRDFQSTPDYSDEVAAHIDVEVRKLVDSAHVVARDVLETNRHVLDTLADALIEHETLEAERVQQILAATTPWTGTRGDEIGAGRPSAVAASDTAPSPRRTTS
jgi:cell division protease FtsH